MNTKIYCGLGCASVLCMCSCLLYKKYKKNKQIKDNYKKYEIKHMLKETVMPDMFKPLKILNGTKFFY